MRKKTLKPKSDLVNAVHEMAAHRRGKISLSTRRLEIPEKIDVASIRKHVGMTQKQFAERYGFILSTVKDWEQGRRTPERSARILLTLIEIDPHAVNNVLNKLSK